MRLTVLALQCTISLSLSSFVFPLHAAPCATSDWTTEGNRCYRFYPQDDLNYPQMQATCQRAGGEMARIDNAQQDALVQSLAGQSRAFIGLTDRIHEDDFRWADGSCPAYTNWHPDEPNDYRGEDCVMINYNGGYWNDVMCNPNGSSEGYVCSADVTPTSETLCLSDHGVLCSWS